MKIYLMARYRRQLEMREVAKILTTRYDHKITSGWIWQNDEITDKHIGTEIALTTQANLALRDVNDISRADICIGFSDPIGTQLRGGKMVELGIALAMGKVIYVVGGREHIFHALESIVHFDTVSDMYNDFDSLKGY